MKPLGPAEHKLLVALRRYHYLGIDQFVRLLYSPGSKTHVQTAANRLVASGHAQRFVKPQQEPTGKPPYVYTLSRQGGTYLEGFGHTVPARIRPWAEQLHKGLPLDHHLAVNEVLISAELLARTDARITINQLIHDRDLQRRPHVVQSFDRERLRVVPDAWIDFFVGASGRVPVCLELDRNTERGEAWKQKIRGIMAWLDGPFAEAFGVDGCTIAVLTTGGATRREALMRWTEEELTRIGQEHDREVFLFSDADPVTTDPSDLYLSPVWTELYTRTRVPLIQPSP